MRNGETGPICSSEQLESVRQLVGPNEPALFTVLQQLTKEYDEKTTLHLAKEFCFMCHSYESKRVGMEFLYMNGFEKDLQELIDINRYSEHQRNREWGYVYQQVLNRKEDRELYRKKLIEFLDEYETCDSDLRCLLLFLRIYSYCDNQDYKKIDVYKDKLTSMLLGIDDTLLRIYFQMRENELMFHHHWKLDEIEIARTYALNIIEHTLSNYEKKCYMLMSLAQTYILEGYEKSSYYAQRALEVAKEHGLKFFEKSINNQVIPFISASNGVYEGLETDDLAEKAHLFIAKGEKEQAVNILSHFKDLTPFQEYYLGLAKEDEKILYHSYERFRDEYQDMFFANLPLNALKKRGWNQYEEKDSYVH